MGELVKRSCRGNLDQSLGVEQNGGKRDDRCYNRKEPLDHTCRRLSWQETKDGGGFEGCRKKSTTQMVQPD